MAAHLPHTICSIDRFYLIIAEEPKLRYQKMQVMGRSQKRAQGEPVRRWQVWASEWKREVYARREKRRRKGESGRLGLTSAPYRTATTEMLS